MEEKEAAEKGARLRRLRRLGDAHHLGWRNALRLAARVPVGVGFNYPSTTEAKSETRPPLRRPWPVTLWRKAMTDNYQGTFRDLLDHADVKVTTRSVRPGEEPKLSVQATVSITSVVALALGTVREMARVAKIEPSASQMMREILELLPEEFDRECHGDFSSFASLGSRL